MVQIFHSVTIVFIFFVQVICSEVKKYNCVMVKHVSESDVRQFDLFDDFLNTNACILEDLTLTSSEKHFLPVTTHPTHEIDAVSFRNSKLEVLTGNVCETLSFVKVFDARSMGLTTVDETAFQSCTKMEIVNLHNNSIATLPPKIFHWNVELSIFYFGGNKLTSIDENLFNNNKKLTAVFLDNNLFRFLPKNLFKGLPNLIALGVHSNQLCELSFLEEMPWLWSLTTIHLQRNKLSDVDVEALHKKFPNLKLINFFQNDLWCDRQTDIYLYLNKNKIMFGNIVGYCIPNKGSWETKKYSNQIQLVMFHQGIAANISTLTTNADNMKDKQLLIFIFLGSLFFILIISFGVNGWLMKKLLTKPKETAPKINVQTTTTRNINETDNKDTDVEYQEYEYVPGFNQTTTQTDTKQDTYDHLQFNQN